VWVLVVELVVEMVIIEKLNKQVGKHLKLQGFLGRISDGRRLY